MPQAPTELQLRRNDDTTALIFLQANFTWHTGMIKPREGYVPTPDDYSAIDYLILEWDYGYESGKEKEHLIDPPKGKEQLIASPIDLSKFLV